MTTTTKTFIQEMLEVVSGSKDVEEVRIKVNEYFSQIVWSLEKDEWTNHMTEQQKSQFCNKLFSLSH